MQDEQLCPFSKPLIGHWCQCEHAVLSDRCSGKMICKQADQYRSACVNLVDAFKHNSKFVLGISSDDVQLTHTQLMKIRCGGLMGMQRLFNQIGDQPPTVLELINQAEQQFGDIENFPFQEIVRDIKAFNHRNKFKHKSKR